MSKVAKATIGLMLATIIAKVLGFGRELVLAAVYGASMYSDAYLTAMNIPVVLFTIIGTTLGTVLIPMYFEVNNDLGEKKALNFTNKNSKKSNNTSSGTRNKILTSNKISTKRNVTNS